MSVRELVSDDVPDWSRAKCAHQPERGDEFFPERGSAQTVARAAKRRCNGEDGLPVCPIRSECLDYAIHIGEKFGVWGGMSERQRHHEAIRREKQYRDDVVTWLKAERSYKRAMRAEARRVEQERKERRERRAAASRRAWETRRRNSADAGKAKRGRTAKSA